jgi:type I restriction enzyme S subunit
LSHNWDSKRIKHLFEERIEKNSDSKNDYLSIVKDVGVIPYSEKGNVGNKTSDNPENYKRVYPDDLVINPMNVTIGSVGISNHFGCLSNVYMVLKPKIEFEPQYYGYLFQIKSFQKSLRKISYGIMEIRESINKIEFFGLELPYPPLSEQQQIVSFLDTKTSLIDSLIEKTQRKIELLKEKRTSLINEVVTKGLNPNVEMKDSGVEWIGKIPSHWEKSKLKYKGVFFSGYSFDSNDFLSEGEIRVLKISNIQNNGISWDDLQYLPECFYNTHQNFSVNKGDLVFVLTRPIISTGIKVCFFNEEYRTLLNQRNSVFRPNESSVIKRFLFYSVRTFSFIEEFKQQLKETNQPNISSEQISNILMFFPQLDEQQQIVEYLDEQTQLIDKTISIEEKRIELLKEYRQSLISEVVTGKRKVVE